MQRLIEWDGLELRVNGAKAAALAAAIPMPPVERVSMRFSPGLLRVSGSVRKVVSLPFSIEIRELVANGREIRVPLKTATAFGGLPIPGWLVSLFRNQLPKELMRFEEPGTIVIPLDRFLPSFVDAEVTNISIIDGGLALTLGRGGADLPLKAGPNGTDAG